MKLQGFFVCLQDRGGPYEGHFRKQFPNFLAAVRHISKALYIKAQYVQHDVTGPDFGPHFPGKSAQILGNGKGSLALLKAEKQPCLFQTQGQKGLFVPCAGKSPVERIQSLGVPPLVEKGTGTEKGIGICVEAVSLSRIADSCGLFVCPGY